MAKTVETVNRASNTLLGLTPEDVERYSKAAVAKEFDSVSSLPNHLQYFEYDIICYTQRGWGNRDITVPSNSIVYLHSHAGTMEMGWNRYVDPTGKFVDNGDIHRAIGPEFTAWPDWNAFCYLVGVLEFDGSTRHRLWNTSIPDWAASVGDLNTFWEFGADEGGTVQIAFNDTDNNNTGRFIQKIRIEPMSAFAERHKNLVTASDASRNSFLAADPT